MLSIGVTHPRLQKPVDVDIVKVFPSLAHEGEVANYTYVHQSVLNAGRRSLALSIGADIRN